MLAQNCSATDALAHVYGLRSIVEKNMRALFAGTLLLISTAAFAQNQQDLSKVEIKTTKITDKFYTLEGQGGTIGVLVGPDGVFLVDTQFAPLTEKIVAAVKKISSSPVKFVTGERFINQLYAELGGK